jgi:hypothetical protein
VLTIFEKALGPDHRNVASAFNNLRARYYHRVATLKPSRSIKRGLAILEQALGPDHRNVASALNSLVGALLSPRSLRLTPSRSIKRGLAPFEKALGRHHHEVVVPLDNLADLHTHQCPY